MAISDLSGFIPLAISRLAVKRLILILGLLLVVGALAGCQPRGVADDPVFSAVRNNDAIQLGKYLAEGGNPDIRDANGDNLLYVASGARGGLEVVNQLLLAGADIDQTSNKGRTPLHTAAAWCNVDIVAALLNAGARVDIMNDENKNALDVVCARPLDRREQVIALFLKVGG
ncbi:hypothetical protein MNBD_ALPHA12-1201 [hydrothermal vent metagenome]|uniref:Uncharacterized protein n=1 Tax=hydrothermal vent metagenome TaxID=652676 RepID=A0A3B0T833_9ZZZZ